MAADLSAYNDALKEVWTQDRLEKQFYDQFPALDRIEKTSKFTIGSKASVPINTYRSGGYSVTPSSGSSSLNAAGNAGVDKAEYTLTYHYGNAKLEHAALEQTASNAEAVADVLDTEVESVTSMVRNQITRQLFGDGTALIAQCTTTSGSTTIQLLSTGYGYDAIARGWLQEGMTVDIGTTGSEAAIVADSVITAVSENATTPTITIGTSVTTSSSHYVSVANARSGSTSYEMNGLRSLVSQSATFGTLAASGQWQAAKVDSTTTALTLPAMLAADVAVKQKGGVSPTDVITSFKQLYKFYDLLQSQVRFTSDSVSAGSYESVQWNGKTIQGHQQCPDRLMFFLNVNDLLFVTGKNGAHWLGETHGGLGGPLQYVPNTTAFSGTLGYLCNLGTRRRNTTAALTALTA